MFCYASVTYWTFDKSPKVSNAEKERSRKLSKKKNEKKFFHGFRATAAEEISSQTNTATAVLLASSSSTAECVVVKRESSSIQSDPVCRTEQSIFPISLPPSAGSSLYTFPPIVPFFSSFLKCSSDKREQSAISFLPLQVNEGIFFLFRPTGTDLSKLREESGMRRVINANVYN